MAVRSISLARLCAVAIAATAIMPIAAAAQTNPLKLFKGTIASTATGKPIDGGRLLVYQGSETEPVTTSKINPGTGFYQVILSPAITYRFEVVSPRFYSTSFSITTPAGTNYEETVKDLKVEPIPLGTTIFSGRLFEPGSSTLEETGEFKNAVDMLKKERAVVVTITVVPDVLAATSKASTPAPKKKGKKGKGATEEPAPTPVAETAPSMKQLGESRMAAVKNLFKQRGISTTRLGWEIKEGTTLQPAKGKSAKYPDNITIKITSIQAYEDNDS